MKLYDSIGPNPRVVRMFAAEKGIALDRVPVDLRGGENRQPAYLARNPAGGLPSLELDDGFVLSEITAICEYLEDTHPAPPLIGTTPKERAETRMWTRRIDLNIAEPLTAGFRYAEGQKLFAGRMRLIPQAADDLKALARDGIAWLDGLLAGRTWVCGDRFTLADILLFGFLDFGSQVRQPIDPANARIVAHHARMQARGSAAA